MILHTGDTFKVNGRQAKVLAKLGGGGFSVVYRVQMDGMEKALKIFRKNKLSLLGPAFRQNLRFLIRSKPPSRAFLFPREEVSFPDGSFGYLMPLIPSDFISLEKAHYDGLLTMTAKLKTMISLSAAMRSLHHERLYYGDLSLANVYVNPKTFAVLLIDCENIAPNGASAPVKGTGEFIAPEVLRNECDVSISSDLHALAVLLFELLVCNHPFHGKRYDYLLEYDQKQAFMSKPVFIFHPQNKSNACKNKDTSSRWNLLPSYIQQLFENTFVTGLDSPSQRTTAKAWAEACLHYLVEGVQCRCGAHLSRSILSLRDGYATCPFCKLCFRMPSALRVNSYLVTLLPERRIYTACTDPHAPASLQAIGMIYRSNDNRLAIGNSGQESWQTNRGEVRCRQGILLRRQLSIRFPSGEKGVIVP